MSHRPARRPPGASATARVALVAAVVLAVLCGCTAATRPGVEDGSRATTAWRTQVGELLDRHGRALLRHDRAAWLADVDPADPAARRAASTSFDDAAAVSWTALRFEAVGPVERPTTGRPAVALRVDRVERVAGEGPGDWRTAVVLGLARRGGRPVLTTPPAGTAGGRTDPGGPADLGPVAVQRSGPVTVLSYGAPAPGELAREVAAGVARVSARWPSPGATGGRGTWWSGLVVELPSSSSGFASLLAGRVGGPPGAGLAAVTLAGSAEPGAARRVVVDPTVLAGLTPLGRAVVLTHEVVHVAAAHLGAPGARRPLWLEEGLADEVAYGSLGVGPARAAPEVVSAARSGHLPAGVPAAAAFGGNDAERAYETAHLLCRFVADAVGEPVLIAAYARVSTQVGSRGDDAALAVLAAAVHRSVPVLLHDWRSWVAALQLDPR